MEWLGWFIFTSIQIYLFIILFIITYKKVLSEKFSAFILSFITWLSLNSFLGLTVSFIWQKEFNLFHFLIVYATFLFIFSIIFLKKIKNLNEQPSKLLINRGSRNIFLISSLILFLILFFSTNNNMPIYGNVDDSAHYEMSLMMYERIFFTIKEANIFSKAIYTDMAIPFNNTRYSYIFGYHYISAILSKITFIEIIYIHHILRCLFMTFIITIPVLFLQAKDKIKFKDTIFYFVMLLFTIPKWYFFISHGFTAQLYSVLLLFIYILYDKIFCSHVKNKYMDYFVMPFIVFSVLNAYILTGALLLFYIIIKCILVKDFKKLFINLLFSSYILYILPIRNQISYFLFGKGNIDEAIVAGTSVGAPNIVLIIIFAAVLLFNIFEIYKRKKSDNSIKLNFSIIYIICILLVYFFYDKSGYIMLKIIITAFPLIIYDFSNMLNKLFKKILLKFSHITHKKKDSIKFPLILSFIGLELVLSFYICNIKDFESFKSFVPDNFASIIQAEPAISKDTYEAVKYINQNYDIKDSGFEYINLSGPEIIYGYILNRNFPYSSNIYDNVNRVRFMSKSAANYNRAIKGIIKGLSNDKKVKKLFFIVNKEETPPFNTDFVTGFANLYPSIINNYNLIYTYGKTEVWLCEIEDNLFYYNIESSSIVDNKNFIMKDFPLYHKSALPIDEAEKTLTLDLNNSINNSSILIYGRLINNAAIKLNLYNNNNIVYEKEVEKFEDITCINIDKLSFDKIDLVISRGNISDSVIIQDIAIVSKVES